MRVHLPRLKFYHRGRRGRGGAAAQGEGRLRFANYQAIAEYGIRGRRSLSGRTALYRPRDFEGATVLDLGCNIGQMMYQAKKWRAKEVIGVEIEPRFVRKARLLSDSRVILGNLDWQATWDRIPRCDVVLVLALIY